MNLDFLERVRQNHALEHATMSLLTEHKLARGRLLAQANASGFLIFGEVPTAAVEQSAREALERLQRGEKQLAVSPFCGTNLAVAGILAAAAAALALGKDNRLRRLPTAMLAATGAVMLAPAVGNLVQRYLTTSAEVRGLSIRRITHQGHGWLTQHRVETYHQTEPPASPPGG